MFEKYPENKFLEPKIEITMKEVAEKKRMLIYLEKLLKELNLSEEFRVKTLERVVQKVLLGG